MAAKSAHCEFTTPCNLQPQRKSGLAGCGAAKAITYQSPLWAGSNIMHNGREAEVRCVCEPVGLQEWRFLPQQGGLQPLASALSARVFLQGRFSQSTSVELQYEIKNDCSGNFATWRIPWTGEISLCARQFSELREWELITIVHGDEVVCSGGRIRPSFCTDKVPIFQNSIFNQPFSVID